MKLLEWIFGKPEPKHVHEWTMWEVDESQTSRMAYVGVVNRRRCKTCGLTDCRRKS